MDVKENHTPQSLLEYSAQCMGMTEAFSQKETCGTRYVGNGEITKGYLWFYTHENYFAITKCDFVFCDDCMLDMPDSSKYLAVRLDYANHLPPGKIISFMEERGDAVTSPMKKGSRVAYTEIMYFPVFYKKHLDTCFPSLGENPVDVLRSMGGEHNWSAEMLHILTDIQSYDTDATFSGLYYVGKAYGLMNELLSMGAERAPQNEDDYNSILAVIAFIEEHLFENIHQSDMLVIANMSPTKLKTLFRQFTGHSITDYISDKKADYAAHLLSSTDLSVEEVATRTGFETASGFSTFFKKHMKTTPTMYRRQMKFYCMKNPSESKMLIFPDPEGDYA